MLGKFYLSFVVAVIGGSVLSIVEVDGQSLANHNATCGASTLDRAVKNLIHQGLNNAESLKAVNLIREELEDVKSVIESNQNNATCVGKKDLEELKTACVSNQHQNNTSNITRRDLEDLRAACTSNRQHYNGSSISQRDLDDLKAACASNQQQCSFTELSTSKQALVSSLQCKYLT